MPWKDAISRLREVEKRFKWNSAATNSCLSQTNGNVTLQRIALKLVWRMGVRHLKIDVSQMPLTVSKHQTRIWRKASGANKIAERHAVCLPRGESDVVVSQTKTTAISIRQAHLCRWSFLLLLLFKCFCGVVSLGSVWNCKFRVVQTNRSMRHVAGDDSRERFMNFWMSATNRSFVK